MLNKRDIPKFEYGFFDATTKECVEKFGSIFTLPIIMNLSKEIIQNYYEGNILDLGAGKELPHKGLFNLKNGRYYSFDNDPHGKFDFNSIYEIDKNLKFSFVLANQFFEHLTIEDSIELMYVVSQHIKVNGKIIITIPNISHPNRWMSHFAHKTFWNYSSLYMLYKYVDFEVIKIARYSKRHPKGFMEKILTKYISRVYRMDWCDSIIMIGTKK